MSTGSRQKPDSGQCRVDGRAVRRWWLSGASLTLLLGLLLLPGLPRATAQDGPASNTVRLYLPLMLRFYPLVPGAWVEMVNEGFEADLGPLWRTFDNDGTANGEYFWGRRTCRSYAGAASAWAIGDGRDGAALACGATTPANTQTWLVYGPFSLASASAAELRFRVWLDSDQGCWLGSDDGITFHGECLTLPTGGWAAMTLDLADVGEGFSLLGKAQAWVGFVFTGGGSGEGAYLDDVLLRACVGGICPAP